MSIRMELSEVNEQTSSVEKMCKSYISSMESVKEAIGAFIDETGLRGKTYESAKDYFSNAYIPLADGIMLLCEEMLKAHGQFPERYIEEVDSNSLDSEILKERIEELERIIEMMESVNTGIPGLDLSITGGLKVLNGIRLKMEEKLQNLVAFDKSSSEIFSNIDELISSVKTGLKEVSSGKAWNSATGEFETDKLNMEWASDIKNKKNENEMVLIDKIINEMTEEDIDEAARLAATDPNAFYEFIGENYINLISSSGVSIIAGSYEHMGKSFKEFGEHLKTLFKDSKSFLKKLKKYTDKAGNYMINKGDRWIKVGKIIGRTNILVGFSIVCMMI